MFFWADTYNYPLYIILIDGCFSVLMLSMGLRFLALTFLPEQLRFSRLKLFTALNKLVIRIFSPLTPRWLNTRSVELYICFMLFIIRFYILPALLGYEVALPTALPAEKAVIEQLVALQNALR